MQTNNRTVWNKVHLAATFFQDKLPSCGSFILQTRAILQSYDSELTAQEKKMKQKLRKILILMMIESLISIDQPAAKRLRRLYIE